MKYVLFLLIFGLGSGNVYSQGKWSSHPDTTIFNYYTQNDISVPLLQKNANGKRILVYYYEHFSIRVNKFNEVVLGNPTVKQFILENFYPIAVDIDSDKMSPDDPDTGRAKTYRKFLKEQTYYIEATPAFSVYNGAGVLRGSKTFLKTTETTADDFLAFMKKRLK